ncbi:GyrI-like domain-containing protein [Aquimarina sp. RZ0]|nr:GyrI-like domain-containing protein [Aquimarina sp. RZ0]
MAPKIRIIKNKTLIGMRIQTSLSENKTSSLWQRFMPRRNEIKNNLNTGYYTIYE